MTSKNSIRRDSLSKQVADHLELLIEQGKYKIGDKIPTEVELMKFFDVSRNTVREAVQSLASAGILTVKQGDGTYVKSANRFNGSMNLKYEQVSPEDITDARNEMELTIARLAAERRTGEDLEQIKQAFLNRRDKKDSLEEDSVADFEFHKAVAAACHNSIIYDLYLSLSSFILNQISLKLADTKTSPEKINVLHEALYQAILNQDAEQACDCVKKISAI